MTQGGARRPRAFPHPLARQAIAWGPPPPGGGGGAFGGPQGLEVTHPPFDLPTHPHPPRGVHASQKPLKRPLTPPPPRQEMLRC